MGTLTTRFGLRKPAPGDLYDVVADENYNSDQIDAAMGDRICTSSTRPSTSIYVGLRCFETDTKAVIVITSLGPTVWRYVTLPAVASLIAMNAISPVHLGMSCIRTDLSMSFEYNGTSWAPNFPSYFDVAASALQNMTGSFVDLTGATFNVTTTRPNVPIKIEAFFDASTDGLFEGICLFGGVAFSNNVHVGGPAGTRGTGGQTYRHVIPTAGTYTCKLQGRALAGSLTQTYATHTILKARVD